MNVANRSWLRVSLRIAGLLIVFGILAGLVNFQAGKRIKGFKFSHKKSIFQIVERKKISLSDIHKANLLPATSPVVINEIGLANPLGPTDESDNPSDWIELYNKSGRPVSLKDCTLTDSLSQTRKWTLPDVKIPPKWYLFIWADGQSRIWSPMEFDVYEDGNWEGQRDEFRTQSGSAWYSSNNILPEKKEFASKPLMGRIEIGEQADYIIWLRIHNYEKKATTLHCRVDEGKWFPVAVQPTKNYTMIRIYNPRAWWGYWKFAPGEHTVDSLPARGEVSIEKILLTRADTPFNMKDPTLHANFRLSTKGELVALYSPQGLPLDYVDFPSLPPGKTYSRIVDGADQFKVRDPTPMGQNLALPPALSLPSGFLSSTAALVAIGADPRDTIRFTLDGSDPTEASAPFPDSLTITQKCVVRARSFRPGSVPSKVETRVFWTGTKPEMTILWLVADPANLWDMQRGIILNFNGRGVQSERPCYAALFKPDGSVQAAEIGLRNQGRGSRLRSPMRSFRVTCRPQYGSEYWPGDIFEGDGPDKLVSFTVRANNLVTHPLGMEIMQSLDLLSPRTRHCLVYMNNEPYGIYFLCEDVERPEYILHHFGHLDIDMTKQRGFGNPLIYGSWKKYEDTWVKANGTPPGNLPPLVESFIDPAYFARWIAASVFLECGDNDQSYFVFDKRSSPPTWSFINWDLDGCFYWFYMGVTNTVSDAACIQGVRKKVHRGLMTDTNYQAMYIAELQHQANHELKPGPWLERLAVYEKWILPHMDFEYQGILNQNKGREEKVSKELPKKAIVKDQQNEFVLLSSVFRTRPAAIQHLLKEELSLRESVSVSVAGSSTVVIDGYPESLPYKGFYFPGTTFSIAAATHNPPLQLIVNGKPVPAGTFETKITGPLSIKAGIRPGSATP